MFNEKKTEWTREQGDLPVYQTPKYLAARDKAVEIIESGKYGVTEADFWILMNLTAKKDKMAYSGLIISHNGCLKINDRLDSKFDPASVALDKEGWGGSLVYTYCNPEQGIYENGEVSKSNCKNDYPYAMAYKRCFDRVVLKLCKLAYDGIYSDSESEEFREQVTEPEKKQAAPPKQDKPKTTMPNVSDNPEVNTLRGIILAGAGQNLAVADEAARRRYKKDFYSLSLVELQEAAAKVVANAEEKEINRAARMDTSHEEAGDRL